jgi:hypothetical protein
MNSWRQAWYRGDNVIAKLESPLLTDDDILERTKRTEEGCIALQDLYEKLQKRVQLTNCKLVS